MSNDLGSQWRKVASILAARTLHLSLPKLLEWGANINPKLLTHDDHDLKLDQRLTL
jgi:hypothetical protein